MGYVAGGRGGGWGSEQTIKMVGKPNRAAVEIAPMGSAAFCAYRGDIVLTRAAAAMNVPMCLSASSLITLEDVRRENPAAWYQAYLAGDVARIEPLVDRVAEAGYDTFVVTADVPVPPNRENNIRSVFRSRSRSRRRSPGIRSAIRIGCSP